MPKSIDDFGHKKVKKRPQKTMRELEEEMNAKLAEEDDEEAPDLEEVNLEELERIK